MRRYETIFILRPSLAEKEIEEVIENTSQIIKNDKGTIIELDRWGMRKLAYLIKKEKQGFYVLLDFCSPSQSVTEMERKFRIDDSVLKYMTVKVTDSFNDDELTAAQNVVAEKRAVVQAAEKAADEAALAEDESKKTTSAASEDKKATPVEDESKKTTSAASEDNTPGKLTDNASQGDSNKHADDRKESTDESDQT